MTAALKAMVDYALDTLGLMRLYATHFAWNPASGRVMQKAGFTYEGILRNSVFKDNKMTDELLYAIVQPETAQGRERVRSP